MQINIGDTAQGKDAPIGELSYALCCISGEI